MSLTDVIGRLDRAQRSFRFKVGASAVVAALAVGGYVALLVAANAPGAGERLAMRAADRAKEQTQQLLVDRGPVRALAMIVDSMLLTIRPIEGRPIDPSAVVQRRPIDMGGPALVAAVFAGVAAGLFAIIWLGLGLSYLGLFALMWALAWPLMLWPPTRGVGQLIMAAAPLLLAFITGMTLLRAALAGPWPITAVARNVLHEAVRMKVSLVFIVLLILLLALAPQSLKEDQPLRYRVQTWLQYGMGLSYAVLALLTLFLSAGTVAFEQRDKVIWQTMTKPVAPWQYVLGKWIGVMGLNAVLLGVTAFGAYLFTEYLRRQPAQGEMAYHVRGDGAVTLGRPDLMTEDRRLLESQVLVARVGRLASPYFGSEWLSLAVEDRIERMREQDQTVQATAALRARLRSELVEQRQERIREQVEARLRDLKATNPTLRATPAVYAEIERDVRQAHEAQYRMIPPGAAQVYLFTGLAAATAPGAPAKATLRYRVNAGSNDPAQIYRIRFVINGAPFERQVALGSSQSLLFDKDLIAKDGTIMLGVESAPENPREMAFPPDGLEVLYVAGGYEGNFARVACVMWVKLGFTAAVAVAAATFLSFPVACLVALTVLLAAETAGYLTEALEYYVAQTREGFDYFAFVVRLVAVPIARVFRLYAELRPTARLVDGRVIGWDTLASSLVVLGAWTAGVLGLGWAVFRRRELATYSGR